MKVNNINRNKPIEERVNEAILRYIYLKVNDKTIVINKEGSLLPFFSNIIAIAKADFEIDKALKIVLKEQSINKSNSEYLRNGLEEDSVNFKVEIEAYQSYLKGLRDGLSDDKIFSDVRSLLNMENNNEHPYNQVFSYEAISMEVKELILPTILKTIAFYQCQIILGHLSKEEFAELIYDDIRALVNNKQDVEATADYLLPSRNRDMYPGPEKADYVNMSFFLYGVIEDYSHQIKAFEVFHRMTEELQAHNKIIKNVKKQLELLKYKEYYEDYSDMYKKVWIKSKILDLHYEVKNEEFQNATVEEMENKLKKIIWEINQPDKEN